MLGGRPGDKIRHVWLHGGRSVAVAELNVNAEHWRTQSRRLRTAPLPDELDVIADPHATDPAAAVETGEVYAAVAALPADYRDVLVAVDVTGLSYKEAARALRIPEGTVMSRLYRARQQVVRRIDGESE